MDANAYYHMHAFRLLMKRKRNKFKKTKNIIKFLRKFKQTQQPCHAVTTVTITPLQLSAYEYTIKLS